MVLVYSLLYPLPFWRKVSPSFIHGKGFRCSFDDRTAIFMDLVPLLFGGVCKTGCRRDSPGDQRNGAVYGSYIYGLNSARGFSLFIIRLDKKPGRDMVCMAGWLDAGCSNFYFLLPQRIQKILYRQYFF